MKFCINYLQTFKIIKWKLFTHLTDCLELLKQIGVEVEVL